MDGPMTEEELRSSISPVSMREFRQAPDWEREDILRWVPQLRRMSDADFVDECAHRILDSALLGNFRGNAWGAHARADICADEASRRHQEAGHAPDCQGSTLYTEGHNKALVSQGYAPGPKAPCTCGAGKGNGRN